MTDKVFINNIFKQELANLKCGVTDDFIIITRIEDQKAFFNYGSCKLHISLAELEEVRSESF